MTPSGFSMYRYRFRWTLWAQVVRGVLVVGIATMTMMTASTGFHRRAHSTGKTGQQNLVWSPRATNLGKGHRVHLTYRTIGQLELHLRSIIQVWILIHITGVNLERGLAAFPQNSKYTRKSCNYFRSNDPYFKLWQSCLHREGHKEQYWTHILWCGPHFLKTMGPRGPTFEILDESLSL